jgi:hypothetical protein
VALVDFAINLAILFGLTVWYGFWPMFSISYFRRAERSVADLI